MNEERKESAKLESPLSLSFFFLFRSLLSFPSEIPPLTFRNFLLSREEISVIGTFEFPSVY